MLNNVKADLRFYFMKSNKTIVSFTCIQERLMKKILTLCVLIIFGLTTAQAQFGKLIDKAKSSSVGKEASKILGDDDGNLDISGGLKEALEDGVGAAVKSLSATNGYLDSPYKILLPKEAVTVVDKLKMVPGFGDVEEKLVNKMNAAAEMAATKATPIFVDAIKGISFADAKNILFGADDAATNYLESGSRKGLYTAFLPVIQNALDEVNARTYWSTIVTKYNSLPFTKDVNPELDDHVNNTALDGMFSLIKVKEIGIREDVSQRTSPLLRDVFGQLDK